MNSFTKYTLLVLSSIYLLSSCANNKTIKPSKSILNSVNDNNISSESLDRADNEYIALKEGNISAIEQKDIAEKLAYAHIKVGEHIIANFYIQEALKATPTDESLKLLMVKNQYLAAKRNSTDISYLKRAIDALKDNISLISDYNYKSEADRMLNEVKQILATENKKIANYYSKIKKEKASDIYNSRALELGYIDNQKTSNNIKDINKY